MKRKNTAMISVGLFISILLASCGGDAISDNTTVVTDTDTEPVETSKYLDKVPELNFNGSDFRILIHPVYPYEMDCAEQNGEITNDAIYERNREIESRFGVNIKTIVKEGPQKEQPAFIKETILAGDDAFDLAQMFVYKAGAVALEGCFVDWYKIPYADLTQSYWAHNINDSFTVDGKLYTPVSDLCVTSMQLTYAYLFNKKLVEDYDLDDFYQVVDDGKWTLDYVNNVVKASYRDLNGDGSHDDEDAYGFITDVITSLDAYFPSCNHKSLDVIDGTLKVNLNEERAINIYEKVNNLVNKNEGTFSLPYGQYDKKYNMFKQNQGLLIPAQLISLYNELRDMEADFGVLPYPKYDESQDAYYSAAKDNYTVLCVPITAPDLDMVGAVIEALSAESKRTVTPAFYKTALQDKYSRDPQSTKMMDLILEGRNYDLSILYASASTISSITYFLRFTIIEDSPYVSKVQKQLSAFTAAADEVYKKLLELD